MRASYSLLIIGVILLIPLTWSSPTYAGLFGSQELPQRSLSELPDWLSYMERHLREDTPEQICRESGLCNLKPWYNFLNSIKGLPKRQQLERVNQYANRQPYIQDIDNYGKEDYWAVVREFLSRSGDCEDYSLTKFFSLRLLGFSNDELRIVVLQDTNLRIGHAVLAVKYGGDELILDNQSRQVISHRSIKHYTPLYTVNEKRWWLHMPVY
ncbi:transglutaminase-like cysteine peptidase [Neptuniibacter sp. 1_MG-2023]|jgi:predicted transglutaminase-like cysteine proteinase|uniref:transglutaminase-like cysteine peptidase n=1 Tax=Neptuniibacter sp. 1_MG-2023 TaxID=3062662 RepID=UPI0026E35895|nr:transglutaminase-like cysteine peptidase [Neptuniibacter sp. 1_MG-2023]MDO6592631.1 transglutaminase-like cysteine peptidase [Neptuniibacter sp. 1_MG-2023]